MKENFSKKILTPSVFLNDVGFFVSKTPGIIGAMRNKKISSAFKEKIMIVTSAVNGCVYCSWFHAKQSISSGISEEEVKNMLNLQFHADASDFEIIALLYAQHYAETDRNPDSEMTSKLFGYYGDKTSKHILLFIRMIFFGNLLGNTWDAMISRFKGKPAANSSLIFEVIVFLLTFWFMIPTVYLAKEKKLSNY